MTQVYNLWDDRSLIEMIQRESLDENSPAGYKTENNVLFGTQKWFESVERGFIPKIRIKGVISSVHMGSHNDYPEFEIDDGKKKTTWTRMGIESAYQVGRRVELIYVEQKFKKYPGFAKSVLQILIAGA
jgi:hypothetical protein